MKGIEPSSRLSRGGSQKAGSRCGTRCAFQQRVHGCRYIPCGRPWEAEPTGGGLIVTLRPQLSCLSNYPRALILVLVQRLITLYNCSYILT